MASHKPPKWLRYSARALLGVLVVLVCVAGAYFFWWHPNRELESWRGRIEPKEVLALENQERQTLAQAFGGAVLLIGLFFTWRTIRQTEENLRITHENAQENLKIGQENQRIAREGQVTERFMRAIDQLGASDQGQKRLEVRLGAIYALERIARDSPRDHWPIMEVLTAYVRENAPYNAGQSGTGEKLGADIQAILTVIGRSVRPQSIPGDQTLDLSRVDLRGARLSGAQLSRVSFIGAQMDRVKAVDAGLAGADLIAAHLNGANLQRAQLAGARLNGCQLSNANLREANLEEADLREAGLDQADLLDANLRSARLEGANLRNARGLTSEQIASASTDETTVLPRLKPQAEGKPHELAAGSGSQAAG